ncbi:5,10-methylenetetrahydrofolate reductase [Candidatus Tenderia electrophaga]|jgi:methylenetetrahydrofolate reductase (NADPH)|uniref:Methylenetetrahydrofolate reductase n=1 Tax=Candidatus Tenderia electrophaga TaxID=1748243 RepID=A0A0S2TG28_9GAMM|nr:5,10-methylenetetrahydrofolate reductase [Candidatus Tenderia electrophaga]
MNTQSKFPKQFSCEFFPPKSEKGADKLHNTLEALAKLEPAYFSVTFGAGGSTQEGTFDTVKEIQEKGYEAAPHLSCIGGTRDSIRALLDKYMSIGVKRIVALRGDLPSGMRDRGDFRYANELVEFIRAETGDQLKLEVAAYPEIHPQAPNAKKDVRNFVRKVKAGANAAITQYFYNVDAYFYFVDECEKQDVDIPIIPGIMPIINYSQLTRFSDMCGAEIPRWIRKRLESFGDDKASILAFGEEVVTDLCRKLLDGGAPGLHFYTMNQTAPTEKLWRNLDL